MPSTENKENEQLQQQEEGKSLLMSSTTTTSPNKNSSKSRNNDFYGAIDSSSKNSNSSDRSDGNTRKNKRDAAPVTYLGLLSSNRNFRYYWLSYVVNRMVSNVHTLRTATNWIRGRSVGALTYIITSVEWCGEWRPAVSRKEKCSKYTSIYIYTIFI